MRASLPPVGQVQVAARAPLRTSSMPPPGPGSPSMPTTRIPLMTELHRGPVRSVSHRVILGKDHVHGAVLREPCRQLVLRLVPQPVRVDAGNDPDALVRRNGLLETQAPVEDRRRAGASHDLHDLPSLAAQQVGDVLPGLLADQPVVGADKEGVVVAHHGAVQEDDRDALVRLRDNGCQRLGVVGRDDEEVDPAIQELSHVLDLPAAGICGVGEHDAEIRVMGRLGLYFLAHVDPPGLGEVREGYSDQELVGLVNGTFPTAREE